MCNVCSLDAARVEGFGDTLIETLNRAGTAMMISIGHRTGLFDAMAALGPMTSAGIAGAAGLHERYVREWLGCMVTAAIVDYEEGQYCIPAEHAALLTRSAAPDNMAAFMQWISVLGSVEDRIVDCFHNGGGVPYSAYGRFNEVMAEESAQTVLPALEGAILPLVPGLIERLEDGIDVLDVGCGSGRALVQLAKRFPNSRFTGYDLMEDAVDRAKAHAHAAGIETIRFLAKDATLMDDVAAFDLVTTFDAVHDQARPLAVLTAIRRALRHNGVYLMQDIKGSRDVAGNRDHPLGPFIYTISCMACMSTSLAQGGDGLGAMWGVETAREFLEAAGFGAVDMHTLEHDIQNVYFVACPEALRAAA